MTARSAADSPFDAALLHALAGDYLSGTATRDEVARLESLLVSNPAARAEFVSLALVHGQLAATLVAAGAADDPRRSPRPGSLSFGRGALRSIRALVATRAAAGTAAVVAVVAVAAVLLVPAPQRAASAYDQRQLPLLTVATLADAAPGAEPRAAPTRLTPTTLRPLRSTSLTSSSGAAVDVPEAAVFGIASGAGGVLYDGSVEARLVEPDASFSVTAENLRIVDKGTAFRVDRVDADHVRVTVTDGAVEVQSRVRLPVCYWSFDDVVGGGPWSATDVVSGLAARFHGGAAPAPGLVGRAAARFDNHRDSAVTIVGGTGDSVGTGLLAAADGISIEAVIASRWSGRFKDYDEIYRKEDGDCRVLLSFQNDGGNYGGFSEPAIGEGPCLSFGLHLAGRGYRELDMPLDGRDGRPTLPEIADGRPHHVVASYDSFTGRKAIFIDGRLRYFHDYSLGTLILSGGPVAATIGNHGGCEPFTGTIDELAIYDFALTPDEVEQHHANVRRAASPFGGAPPASGGPRWQAVTRLGAGESQAFNQRTGLPVATPRDELD
jgi:hypothetical protein